MMNLDVVLDELAPGRFVPDWDDVLARVDTDAGRSRKGQTQRLSRTRRRVLVAIAVAAAIAIPVSALAASHANWWFLRFGTAPAPVGQPTIVKTGDWDGQKWELVAYRSDGGLCFSMNPLDTAATNGFGAALGCAPFVGGKTAPPNGQKEMNITMLSGSRGANLPSYAVGPVVAQATEVGIYLRGGHLVRVPTFDAPESLGPVRFYATRIPTWSPNSGARGSLFGPITKLVGYDSGGHVVACLVRDTAVDGVSPLADCR